MYRVISWVSSLTDTRNYTLRNYTLFLLVLFCIQYIPIESREGVSWVKVTAMAVTAIIYCRYMVLNKAAFIGFIYMAWIMLTAYGLHSGTFRASTVIYLYMYVVTFIAFYTFVWDEHVLEINHFINFLKNFIFVLVVVLVAQQCCLIAGIKLMPILNLCQVLDRGIGANSLTFEPSTLGRLLNILYYAYLKCNEYRRGYPLSITEIFNNEHRWVTIAFLWGMLSMGSGTAILAMSITALYFMRGKSLFLAIPMFIGVFFVMNFLGLENIRRAAEVSKATATGNAAFVRETDTSAAMRIYPILNTLNMDLSDSEIWVGHGCDAAVREGYFSSQRYMGQITDYGLISYILELSLIFTCCLNFFSIGTILFFIGAGGMIGNISYGWGLLMIFSCIKYFHDCYIPEESVEILNESYSSN